MDFDNFGEQGVNNAGDLEVEKEDPGKNDEEPQAPRDSNALVWTQAMDEILISNYKDFQSLGSKCCFQLLSALIPGTTAKDCYKRGKKLKLKTGSE